MPVQYDTTHDTCNRQALPIRIVALSRGRFRTISRVRSPHTCLFGATLHVNTPVSCPCPRSTANNNQQWQTATPTSSQRGLRNEATTTLSMAATDTRDSSNPVRVAILGASGYTGAELVRLLLSHSGVEIAVLTGNTQAGKPFSDVYPQFSYAKVLLFMYARIRSVNVNMRQTALQI